MDICAVCVSAYDELRVDTGDILAWSENENDEIRNFARLFMWLP